MTERFKVMVADGNRHVREFLRRELALADFEAVTAGNSRELLQAVEKDGRLDLLVVDPDMPLLDQGTLAALLDGRIPPLPTILYGYGEESRSRTVPPPGCLFVERGEDVDRLKEAVHRMLQASYPQRFRRWRSSAGYPPGFWRGSDAPKLHSP